MNLPSGTITFLFTDIEGSTRLWEEQPDTMRLSLFRHDALLRAAIETNKGVVFKTFGDAFCAAFPTAPQALEAALSVQQGLRQVKAGDGENLMLKVRMALHTGVAEYRDSDYFGQPLNRIARLLSVGHGGQVLVSSATQELVRDTLSPACSLLNLGEHRLRDLARPETVFQLLHPDLPAEFPPLKSLDNPQFPNNLPLQLTSFIGREKVMEEVKSLLAKTRLLTLTGSGGCGKTRLSLQVAADVLEDYPDGVWQVTLAALAEAALVPNTVAQALGVTEQAGKPLQQTLIDTLKSKRLLLVLDNCEHLLSACAQFVGALLRSCPNVTALATSREPLGVAGELTYRVPSLSVPDPGRTYPWEALSQYEAVRLFIERAQFQKPEFVVTNQNAPALAQLCHRLDGIPLAIELATARVRSLSVEDIHSRLDNRFRLLTGGDRTALPRQQTLRALIDWSYDLLDVQEKVMLARLSVFTGGWTLLAAEKVCADLGDRGQVSGVREESRSPIPDTRHSTSIEEWEILDLATSLVDKSLALAEEQTGSARYRLLETVRQYAWEKLQASGEADAIRNRHRDWCMALAEEAEPQLLGTEQAHWLARLETERPNLRAALAWSLQSEEEKRQSEADGEEVSPGAAESGLRLARLLWRFWYIRGHWNEGREHLERALAREGAQGRTIERARALSSIGTLAFLQDDDAAARKQIEEALALFRELGDKRGIAASLNNLGAIASKQGDFAGAWPLHEESLALFRELEDKHGLAFTLADIGVLAHHQGDYAAARTRFEESLALNRVMGNKLGIANMLANLGDLAYNQGDYVEARVLFEESLDLFREAGDKRFMALSLANLGLVTSEQGDYVGARTRFEEGLVLFRELGDKLCIAFALEALAGALSAHKAGPQSARLWGAAAALRQSIGSPLPPNERERYDQRVAQSRAALGEDAFIAAWEEGRALSWEQAVSSALEETNLA